MASITRGITFGATEQVTNTKLHTLVDSATLSSISQTDLSASLGLVSVGSSAPSDTDQLWVDTSLSPYVVKYYNGSAWVPDVEGQVLTNKSGQSLSAGHVTIIDTSNANSVTTTATAGSTLFGGVSVATVANNAAGVFKRYGYVPAISLEISASAGSFLRTSTASGKAEPRGNYGSGSFGFVTQAGTASAAGFIFGAPGGGVGLTDTNTWTALNTFSATATVASGASLNVNAGANFNLATDAIVGNSLVKSWVHLASAVAAGSYNLSSVSNTSTGIYNLVWLSAFASTAYAIQANGKRSADTSGIFGVISAIASSSAQIVFKNQSDANTDIAIGCITAIGVRA